MTFQQKTLTRGLSPRRVAEKAAQRESRKDVKVSEPLVKNDQPTLEPLRDHVALPKKRGRPRKVVSEIAKIESSSQTPDGDFVDDPEIPVGVKDGTTLQKPADRIVAKRKQATSDVSADHGGIESPVYLVGGDITNLMQYLRRCSMQRTQMINQKGGAITRGMAICRSYFYHLMPKGYEPLEKVGGKQQDPILKKIVEKGTELYNDIAKDKPVNPAYEDAVLVVKGFLAQSDLADRQLEHFMRGVAKRAKDIPAADFILGTRGISIEMAAILIGITGDLRNFSGPYKLFRYLGIGLNTDGTRQRRVKGEGSKDQKYDPRKRSLMWVIGNGLIGGMGNGKRPKVGEDISLRTDWSTYERLFVERLRIEVAKNPDMGLPPTESGNESFTRYAAARAKRFVEKRFLKDFWIAWGRALDPDWDIKHPIPNYGTPAET